MGRMKDFIMEVSEDMGHYGDINDEVLAEAQHRLANLVDKDKEEVVTEDMLIQLEEKK
jgi:hypothetical protein